MCILFYCLQLKQNINNSCLKLLEIDPKDQYEEVQKYLNFLFHNTTGKEVLSFLSWAIITKF